ncbi:MAG: hypothetical protein O3B31_15045 [Chloroflexi bacterium]|nr:hypothetical protein [Chloroflexota bacterium]
MPSLFLVAQVMQEWTANCRRPFEFLAVCSDETVVAKQEDRFVANVSEIGVPVTTDPGRIHHPFSAASRHAETAHPDRRASRIRDRGPSTLRQ